MQVELEEKDANLEQQREELTELVEKFKQVSNEFVVCDAQRQKFQASYEKYSNMCQRLQEANSVLEERQQDLIQEVQRLEMLAENIEDF